MASIEAKLSDQMMILGTTAALFAGVASAVLGLATIEPRSASLSIGVALGLAGVTLRTFAMSALGTDYTLTPQVEPDQVIVTTGPYRWVRHPGYSGILLSLLGLQLISGTWVAVASLLFVILPVPLRIELEERMLRGQSGATYHDYERHTRYRLVPGIY
jgi:protein-S-isoprenylcysteine O-methyltransferase Ste14